MELDVETMQYVATAVKYFAIGMLGLPLLAAAKGVSDVFTTFITGVSRNPNVKKDTFVPTIIGAAMVEAIALYSIGLAFTMYFVK